MSIKFTTVSKVKSSLQVKTKTRKKALDQQVSVDAVAAGGANQLSDLNIEKLPISALKTAKRRVRKTSPEQLKRVMRSIQELNQCTPVVIDAEGNVINGHIVVEALKKLGHTHAWCVRIDHLSPHQCELLHVTLNRSAEQGEWNMDALGPLLVDLAALDFDLGLTGFSLPELDIIIQPPLATSEESADDAGGEVETIPELPTHPVSVVGDLWQLGDHLLLCGNATDPASYQTVLGGIQAAAIFTDCPWNIKIEGFVSGLGKTKHKDFVAGAGEMTDDEFAAFCDTFTKLGAQHLMEGGTFFSCIDHRSLYLIYAAGMKAGLKWENMAVWYKGTGGMGSYLRSAHELIPIFVKGDKLGVNNVELGKHGRNRTNVWCYPGANQPGSSANEGLKFHPTCKPIEMVEDAILDVTKRGAIVLDMFMGSGTTLLAAQRCGRKARGIELDPKYVDVIVGRWQAATDKLAIHVETGMTMVELAAERAAKAQQHAA